MALAQRLTEPQPQQIDINPSGASPGGVKIADQQSVTFTNTTRSAVSITFFPPGVFTDIPSLQPGPQNSQTLSPNQGDTTVNYYINGNQAEPYAIEVGTGPFVVTLNAGESNPEAVALPVNGEIQFNAKDQTYYLAWSADPFTPPINSVQPGVPAVGEETGAKGRYSYTLSTTPPSLKQAGVLDGGGGTIKVT